MKAISRVPSGLGPRCRPLGCYAVAGFTPGVHSACARLSSNRRGPAVHRAAFSPQDDGVMQQSPAQLDLLRESGGAVPSTSGRPLAPNQNVLPAGTMVGGKYKLQQVLGTGSNAITYRATAINGQEVAVKALSLRGMRDWKQLELFQREAQTLKALNHPGIPRYIDYFEDDMHMDHSFFIVQEVAQGISLAEMIQSGNRTDDAEARRIARELLGVLQYLGSLRPPVVHRDVKPENIVLEGGRWGGRVFLVDFGGVQAVASAKDVQSLGSTIVGTYGYMAPEQFRGAAQPASDLYSLGGTLLLLLSGSPPYAYPQARMRVNWRSTFTPPSDMWGRLLDGLLEPVAEDRFSAAEALALLEGQGAPKAGGSAMASRRMRRQQLQAVQPPKSAEEAWLRMSQSGMMQPGAVFRKPAGSRVQLDKTANRLDITIPAKGLSFDTTATGAFAVFWNAFVAVWTFSAIASGGILFALFSVPFWFAGAQLGRQAVAGALTKERMAIGRSKFRIGQELAVFGKDGAADFLGGPNEKVIEGQTADLQGARVVTTVIVNGVPQTAMEVIEGVRKYRFGEGLELSEQQWLVNEINSHLEQLQNAPIDYMSFPAQDMPQVYQDAEDEFRRGTGMDYTDDRDSRKWK